MQQQNQSNISDKQGDFFQTSNIQLRKPVVPSPQNLSFQDKTKLNVQRQQPWNKVSSNVVQQLHGL